MTRSNTLLVADAVSVHAGAQTLLRPLSFALQAGDSLTLLGESGAGKFLLAQALMGRLPAGLQARGQVQVDGHTTAAADGAARRPLWGRTLALLPQEPRLALAPLRRLLPQLSEVHHRVRGDAPHQSVAQAHATLVRVDLAAAAHQHPGQLSGGMAQRAVAAIAMAGGARILLADEPTKGLDAVQRDHLLNRLREHLAQGGVLVMITHDLQVARALGGQLMVLRDGEVVETGHAEQVLHAPQAAFTRTLCEAEPHHWPRRPTRPRGEALLTAEGLQHRLGHRTLFQDLSLRLHRHDRWVLRGPSGAGKSTLGNLLVGLQRPQQGRLHLQSTLHAQARQKLFQDPVTAFPPSRLLAQTLADAARQHHQPWAHVQAQLARLGLGDHLLQRLPSQLSGGELQRLALIRALLARPAVLLADEPTSRLDLITQRHAMQLLLDAVEEAEAALVLITHDDAITQAVATHVQGLGATESPAVA